jgi:arylsulfatase A-like enzyme
VRVLNSLLWWSGFLGVISVLIVACGGGESKTGSDSNEEASRDVKSNPPNILLIIVDDLNTQVGFLGDETASTPRMDALANQSIVFEHAYAQAPICNPSRASFLTGIYPHSTGLYGQMPEFWEVEGYDGAITLPLHFRGNGYHTASIGKVTNYRRHTPSFDYTQGWFGAFGPFPDQPINLPANSGFSKYYDWGPLLSVHETADYKVASAAIDYIRSEPFGESPFFLAVGFFRPHVPLYAPEEYFDLHPIETVKVPSTEASTIDAIPDFAKKLVSYNGDKSFKSYLGEPGRGEGFLQAYRASVSLSDEQIGRVLDSLAESGFADNTIVVMISDHGVQNGAKNLWFKRTLWEKTLAVPMVIHIPNSLPRRIEMPVGLIDLFPTLSELSGLPVPEQAEGVSLVPWIEAPEGAAWQDRAPVVSVHGPGNVSIRDRQWRYIRYEDGSEELYDHRVDSDESKNLVSSDSLAEVQPVIDEFRRHVPLTFSDFAPGTSGMASAAYPGK